jgi:predicted RNA binding protein YcfA (HicA-like mRNA interferase family)
MVRRTCSGREIVSLLDRFGFVPVARHGSHVRLRDENADTGEVRNVDVPLHDEVRIGTRQSIADQCGADDVRTFCEWLDEHSESLAGEPVRAWTSKGADRSRHVPT